ncbi:hypothetical protein [Parasitella parasitica]|uniref:Uncharacterized protein n=1 Tax=Parasitella parasitica TaxID=35722 RepID=A0A0B7NAS7_9FUNG|nr:hypothetical protein [Parasitella parasitica]
MPKTEIILLLPSPFTGPKAPLEYNKVLLGGRSQPRLRKDYLYVACSRNCHAVNLHLIADEALNPEAIHTLIDLHVKLQ